MRLRCVKTTDMINASRCMQLVLVCRVLDPLEHVSHLFLTVSIFSFSSFLSFPSTFFSRALPVNTAGVACLGSEKRIHKQARVSKKVRK